MILPPTQDSVDWKNYHVDATPDGEYALRILKLYRERARTKWIVSGLSDDAKLLYDYMNETQDKRLEELNKAIEILEK